MAKIVCIHGIDQEYEAEEVLANEWIPAVCGGVSNAGGKLEPSEVSMCYYGGLFRPRERSLGKGTPGNGVAIEDQFERELLVALADAAAPEESGNKALGIRRPVQAMLHHVAQAPYFGRCAQSVVIWWLKQVWWYITNHQQTRQLAQKRLLNSIASDTRIIVAHSLGTVIAYEVLCGNPYLAVRTLITLGSPLGIPVLRPRLQPPVDRLPGHWPESVSLWFNIADRTDIVALEKKLASVFGDRVQDRLVHNGATMHNVKPYLTAPETGAAIMAGLSAGG